MDDEILYNLNTNPESLLRALFNRAIEEADPMRIVPKFLPPKPEGRVVVIGAGKASARMAEALESVWGACEGLVITRHGYARPTKGIEIVEAAHPVPDEAGMAATQRIIDLLGELNADDHVVALISGGGSALLCAPAEGLSLAQKRDTNAALLASGAPIGAMNVIRSAISKVKAGRLAANCAAPITSLLISDIPGDDLGMIASGPTVASQTSLEEVLALREQWLPKFEHLDEVIKSNHSTICLTDTTNTLIANPSSSLKAAAELAESAGIDVTIWGDAIEGEAREVARQHAKMINNASAPHIFLSGGELTVTKKGNGIGGPNVEYALALALALDGANDIYALAGDTDGVDGAAEIAGAIVNPTSLNRGGINEALKALKKNDAHSFFKSISDQVITSPTYTNVNDFRAIFIVKN